MGNKVVVSSGGFRQSVRFRRPFHVVMLGLDESGKTAILYRSKWKDWRERIFPTPVFNVEIVRPYKDVSYKIWDVSGKEHIRPLWKAYARQTDAIIFVVDSTNEERMDEAKEELHNLVNCAQLNGAPILVFANKQDLPNALTPFEVTQKLSLPHLNTRHLWYLQPTSAVRGDGIVEGLKELADMIGQWKIDLKNSKKSRRSRRKRFTTSRSVSVNNILWLKKPKISSRNDLFRKWSTANWLCLLDVLWYQSIRKRRVSLRERISITTKSVSRLLKETWINRTF